MDRIVSLYAPDALFLGTGSTTVVTEPADIRKYLEAALLSNRPRGVKLRNYKALPLLDSAIVVTGLLLIA